MYVRFWQNIDSITCLLGDLKMLILLMCVSFWQKIDSVTCLLGSLTSLDFVYVRKVLHESRLYHLFMWKSKESGFCFCTEGFGRILTLLSDYLEA